MFPYCTKLNVREYLEILTVLSRLPETSYKQQTEKHDLKVRFYKQDLIFINK